MAVTAPTPEQFLALAEDIGLDLSELDAKAFVQLVQPTINDYNVVDAMADELPRVKYPRTPGYRPMGDENPNNAWYYKSTVKGAARGKLKGKTVAIKDNIMLAGVPMMNGSATMEGYIPEIDATVVTRILDAGGEILGKAHCEAFCCSGGSHTNVTGPVHNPWRHGFSAGGSSSGSAALVAAGEVDMALGGDQGGSIRIPAAYCGLVGLKPTHGLVPYTGIMPIEVTIDHTGPMTAKVHDNALMLEAIAGADGFDPRQNNVRTKPYTKARDGGVAGLKVGVLSEGFVFENLEPDVADCVRQAAVRLQDLGAEVKEVSVPMHLVANAIGTPIGVEGIAGTMMWGDGYGHGRGDLYVPSLMDYHRGWRQRVNELADTVKVYLLLGTYITRRHGFRYYGKSTNIARRLTAAYDAVLEDVDLLLMPTSTVKATPLPERMDGLEENFIRAVEMFANTAPFDVTHHPAMSLPCGLRDGLPVGVQLVGRHFDEPTIYRAAYAFEQSGNWCDM
ncbi:MAG: amidase [Pseudomonadota bacterium]|nr:amidase [Pseudomonadota bacterium]